MYKTIIGQSSGKVKKATLLGQEYLVVPVIAMIEGVRFGAAQDDAELGMADEFGKFPEAWNNRPVVLNHPRADGNFVSAGASPAVLEEYYLGITQATRLDGDKLKMEAWLNVSAKDTSDEMAEIFERVEAGDDVEVSVGFFCEVEAQSGKYKGKNYSGIWRNIVPDHLAFLEKGTIGACSVKDGCGAPRVNSTLYLNEEQREIDMLKVGKKKDKDAKKMAQNTSEHNCTCDSNPKCCSKAVVLTGQKLEGLKLNADNEHLTSLSAKEVEAIKNIIAQTVADGLMTNDVISSVALALEEEYDYSFVIGVTNTDAIFTTWHNGAWRVYKRAFNCDADGKVTFTSEAAEVRLLTRIVPITQSDGNEPQVNETTQENDMTNKDPKAQTEATATTEAKPEVAATAAEPAKAEVKEPAVQAETKKPLTAQEYIEAAPAEFKDVLKSSLAVHEKRKAELIQGLKDTKRNSFSDDFLKSQSLEVLEQLSSLAAVPDYSGKEVATARTQTSSEDNVPAAPKVFAKKTA